MTKLCLGSIKLNKIKCILGKLSNIQKIIVLSWKAQPVCFTGVVLLELIQSFIPVGSAWITKLIFDLLAKNLNTGPDKKDLSTLLMLLVVQLILNVSNQLISLLIGYLSSEMGRQLNLKIQVSVYQKINDLKGLAPFENPHIQNTIKLASQGAQKGSNQTLSIFYSLLHSTITLSSFLGVLIVFNPVLAVLVMMAVLPQIYIQFKFGRQHFDLATQNSPLERLAGYYSSLLSAVHFAKEVRLLNLGSFFLEAYKKINNEINLKQKFQQLHETYWQASLSILSNLVTSLLFMVVVIQVFLRKSSLGDVTFYVSAVGSVQGALSDLFFNIASINESLLFFSHYTELLALQQPIYISTKPICIPPLNKGIEFRNVSFRYTEQHPWVLRNINFFLPARQCLALVGLNGAGKTTLVKLLTRLYDPCEGQILWEGVNINEMDPTALRERISSVLQDFVHFEFTAYENIALGDITIHKEEIKSKRVKQSALKVGIHEKIMALPKGYETTLSRWLAEDEKGVDLSGGEWQKVALARLLFRNSDLLILDEPTSSLDAQAEYEINSYLIDTVAGKTSLLISHRFNTVRRADIIAVIENGSIKEYGTHDELIALNGLYNRLYRLQADQYC